MKELKAALGIALVIAFFAAGLFCLGWLANACHGKGATLWPVGRTYMCYKDGEFFLP
jgi:hypothetical protein